MSGARGNKTHTITSAKQIYKKVGANREQSPETHSNNYIDHGDHYHIGGAVDRAPPHTYALEFVMQTKGPGRYPILLEIITEIGEAKPKKELYLTVVDGITGVVGAHLAEDEALGSPAQETTGGSSYASGDGRLAE
jgi:hypothetical protein